MNEHDDGTMMTMRKFRGVMKSMDLKLGEQYHEDEVKALRKGLKKNDPERFLQTYMFEKMKINVTKNFFEGIKNDDEIVDSFNQF